MYYKFLVLTVYIATRLSDRYCYQTAYPKSACKTSEKCRKIKACLIPDFGHFLQKSNLILKIAYFKY